MVANIVDITDLNVRRAWEVLLTSAEWQTIEKYLQEQTLPRAYTEACARPDQPGRDWLAGRAATIQQLLLDAFALRTSSGRSQMPLVHVKGAYDGR